MTTTEKIIDKIQSYPDWRGERLTALREIINECSPELSEDFKWNVPVWTDHGLVCAISAFKDHVKINFFQGAHLPVSPSIFNSGLDSKDHRSINFSETDSIDTDLIKKLVLAAIEYNKQEK